MKKMRFNRAQIAWGASTTVIFLIAIFGGTIASIAAPKRAFSSNENRFLQQMPQFTLDAFMDGTFEEEYETYVTDQFIGRDSWIALKTSTERALQKKDINGVYFAKDHYLIERHEKADIKNEQVQKNIERLTQFVNQTVSNLGEDRVKVMLVPTASEILTDKLPAYASGFDQLAVIGELKELLPQNTLVDITDTLREHAREYIYYKTDHHWTTLGAYYAYLDWANSMGFTAYTQEEFEIVQATNEFYGTIASKVNVSVEPDEINLYEKKGEPLYQVEYNQTTTATGLYEYDSLEKKDKYTVFLNGNNALVKITTENKNGRKLLVIKDSFSHCFVPFLVDHYETVEMVDFRYFRMGISEFMEQEGITDVLVLYNVINFAKDVNSLSFVR